MTGVQTCALPICFPVTILRGWVFGITVFIAAFTPSADPLTMMLLAIPLYIFYFAAGGIALLNDRKRRVALSD